MASEGQGAAREAVAAMRSRGIDISAHTTTSIGSLDWQSFDGIVALDPTVVAFLVGEGVDPSKVRKVFVTDPIGGDAREYEACARDIEARLDALMFSGLCG